MIEADKPLPEEKRAPVRIATARSLSSKVLVLTITFVMIAEVLIFVPSVANFRMRWLQDRLNTAAVAAVVLANAPEGELSRPMQDDVLMATGAKAIVLREKGVSRLLAVEDMPPQVDIHVDLSATGPLAAISGVVNTVMNGGTQTIRVYGPVGQSSKTVEIILSDKGLYEALLIYARNVFYLSILISLITGGLTFLALRRMMIAPIRAMTANMLRFSAEPENPGHVMKPTSRQDEIGVAESELAAMQTDLQRTLQSRKHLADLGLAVSKINHDMRNMLAPAQLLSDRLTDLEDPAVRKIAPRLLRALDRAVTFSESVLAYGKGREQEPNFKRVDVRSLCGDVYELLNLDDTGLQGIEALNHVPEGLVADADPDQLFRIISNLVRNAAQALQSHTAPPRRIIITGGRIGAITVIGVEDTGPGMPQKARDNLFSAFKGSARAEGTGLGLAIAHELVTLHGGTIELRDDRDQGAHFEIRIPDRPVQIADWKRRHDGAVPA
ncbi:MAG: HAMP domain-containing sensor histidine kinase [Rhizobiaceae bacterium]